jgi:hypothetical protein
MKGIGLLIYSISVLIVQLILKRIWKKYAFFPLSSILKMPVNYWAGFAAKSHKH